MGLNEEIRDIKAMLNQKEEEKKEKKFKLPFGKKVGKFQAKKNYVTIMKINENGNVDFQKRQIVEQTFMEDGIPRLGTPNYVLRWKKNPIIIIPSWSVKPYSPEEQYNKSLNDGSNTKGYKILLAKMLSEVIKPTKQMGGIVKWILGLGLVGIIAYAFLTGGGA